MLKNANKKCVKKLENKVFFLFTNNKNKCLKICIKKMQTKNLLKKCVKNLENKLKIFS